MFEEWQAMEQFYYGQLPLLILAVVCILLLIFTILPHRKQSIIKNIINLLLVSLSLSLAYIAFNYYQFWPYIAQIKWIDAGVRSIDKKFLFDYPYSFNEQQAYKHYNNRSNFAHLPFYQAKILEEPLNILGKDDRYLFFELNQEKYKVPLRLVEFRKNVKQAVRQGIQYQLTNQRFTDLGFYSASNKFLQVYLIPENLQITDTSTLKENEFIYSFSDLAGWYNP